MSNKPNLYIVNPAVARDRAAIVTTAILQLGLSSPCGGNCIIDALRDAIEALLRDEFADITRTTMNETRLQDERLQDE